MKYITLLSFLFVFLYTSCTEEEPSVPEITTVTRLIAKEFVGSFEQYVYTYEDGFLQEMIYRSNLFDPISQTNFIDTAFHNFFYSEGRLDRIVLNDNIEYQFDYPGEDLQITEKRNGDLRLQVRFNDYLSDNVTAIDVIHPIIMLDGKILTNLDDNLNVSSATDENGVMMEDAYTSLAGKMYNFYGDMEYDDKKSAYSNLPPELQLWLNWHKNPNNLLRKEMQSSIWEYEYVYDEESYPITSTRTVYNLDTNTAVVNDQVTYEYIVE